MKQQVSSIITRNTMRRKKPHFSISTVAGMFSIHQQTIRLYEREGFLCPKRSEGNTRLFSEEDINKLEEIIYLTHKLGINLAGVQVVLKLQKQIKKMQRDMNKLFDQTKKNLSTENELHQQSIKEQVARLSKLKQAAEAKNNTTKPASSSVKEGTEDKWKVDYEE